MKKLLCRLFHRRRWIPNFICTPMGCVRYYYCPKCETRISSSLDLTIFRMCGECDGKNRKS
jgi:hypothetical protein